MDEFRSRLIKCFHVVFPNMPESAIPEATQLRTPDWDSVATITLVNVIEDEFEVQLDLDVLAELDSFVRILEHLNAQRRVAEA